MSYDLKITKGHASFEEYLKSRGAANSRDEVFTLECDKPSLYFDYYKGGQLSVRYNDNHYNAIFMYAHLLSALRKIEDLEFEDPQLSKTFNKASEKSLTVNILNNWRSIAKIYTETGQNASAALKQHYGEEITPISNAGRIPVQYEILHRLTDDIYRRDSYYRLLEKKGIDVFIPNVFLFINKEAKTYKIMYAWSDMIDIFLPDGVPIDYIMLDKNPGYFKYEDVKAVLPEPEIVEYIGMGKRIYYKGLEPKFKDYLAQLESKRVQFEKAGLDQNLYTPYSVM